MRRLFMLGMAILTAMVTSLGAVTSASAAVVPQKGAAAPRQVQQPPGYFEIRSAVSPFCLDVAGGGSGNGDGVELESCTGSNTQYWAYDGTNIVNYAHGKCLDAVSQSIGNGDKVQVWSCNGRVNQGWCLGVQVGICPPGDALSIVNDDGGLCLDAKSQDLGNGDPIQLWLCRGTNNQHWFMYPP